MAKDLGPFLANGVPPWHTGTWNMGLYIAFTNGSRSLGHFRAFDIFKTGSSREILCTSKYWKVFYELRRKNMHVRVRCLLSQLCRGTHWDTWNLWDKKHFPGCVWPAIIGPMKGGLSVGCWPEILLDVRHRLGYETVGVGLKSSVKCRVANPECRCRATLILGWMSVLDGKNGPVSSVGNTPFMDPNHLIHILDVSL